MPVTEKAKTVEEKFQKLKEVYRKVREEHIQLIRQVSCRVLTRNSNFIWHYYSHLKLCACYHGVRLILMVAVY